MGTWKHELQKRNTGNIITGQYALEVGNNKNSGKGWLEVSSMLAPIEVIEDDILADIETVDRKTDLDSMVTDESPWIMF